MSGDLKITFAPDMPVASVEVVAPDLQTVERVMLGGGRSKTVRVPSEESFLRIHLPSGRTVILKDPGKLERVISLQSLEQPEFDRTRFEPSFADTLPELPKGEKPPSRQLEFGNLIHRWYYRTQHLVSHTVRLGRYARARVLLPNSQSVKGSVTRDGSEGTWELPDSPTMPWYRLQVELRQRTVLEVQVPCNVKTLHARADAMQESDSLLINVRLLSREPSADTILNYLQRGDLYSAETMTEWVDQAEEMLMYKMQDPYAAAVGAYLLLRLKRFDNLHDWARNLANRFNFFPMDV